METDSRLLTNRVINQSVGQTDILTQDKKNSVVTKIQRIYPLWTKIDVGISCSLQSVQRPHKLWDKNISVQKGLKTNNMKQTSNLPVRMQTLFLQTKAGKQSFFTEGAGTKTTGFVFLERGVFLFFLFFLLLLLEAPMQSKVVFIQAGSQVICLICCFWSVECVDPNHLISSECTGCCKYYGKWWSLWSLLLILPNISSECQEGYGGLRCVWSVQWQLADTHTYCLAALLADSALCGQLLGESAPCVDFWN